MIPKHNIKRKNNFFLNVNHGEKLCFTEFNTTWIYWNRILVASSLLFLFTQSNKFSKFNWHMLRKRLFVKLTENEKRLLLSASFTTKFELVLVLTQENAFSWRFHFKTSRKSIWSSKSSTRGYFQNSHSFERLACLWNNHNILNILTLKKKFIKSKIIFQKLE